MRKPTVEFKIEKVEVKPGTRKLKGNWKVEFDPEMVVMYTIPETRWEKFCRWVKYLFAKGKIEKL